MEIITLDFSGIKSLLGLHEYLKDAFELPAYYGKNMDALWDCLHCYYDNTTTIILKNIDALPRDMDAAVETMLELFRDLEKEDGVVLQIAGHEMNENDISGYLI